MKIIFSEFGRELKRNLREINSFYKSRPNTISSDTEDIDRDNTFGNGLAYLLAPAIYLVGVLEPIVETPTRVVLNRYSI